MVKQKTDLTDKVNAALGEILDPELYISIVDLGLVYEVKNADGSIYIKMTLTTVGCPLFETIEAEIKEKVGKIKGVKDVKVELVFDPPWSMEKLTEKAKAIMGI